MFPLFSLGRQELLKDSELRAFVEHKLGGWPIASAEPRTEQEPFDLIDFHKKLDAQGYSTDGLIHISAILDVFNTSRNTILIAPPSAGLHHSYLLRNSTDIRIRNYFALIKDAVQAYNPDLQVDDEEVWKLVNFEKKLASLVSRSFVRPYLSMKSKL